MRPGTHEQLHRAPLPTGVALHWTARGPADGEPVVFVHGGGKNWKQWARQLEPFAEAGYRAVAYSRRYAEPNDNPGMEPSYDATVDARDLEALLDHLGLPAVHLVGASIGGVACLYFALAHRERVRSLVLGEPPVLRWALDIPGGREPFEEFYQRSFLPAGDLFRVGEPERAMGVLMDAFLGAGAWEGFSETQRKRVMRGARDWAAQSTSQSPFPELSRDAVRHLDVPALLLTGERTIPVHAMVDAELARLLPNARRVLIPNATHDMWADAPERCREETLRFLAGTKRV